VVDHPAGDYSPNQYITRDDVHTDPVTFESSLLALI
jgi:hypothetical protein